MNFNNVLKNKYLYYFAVALMVINVLGYVSLGSIECVLVLGGAAYLANQFTKNRTVDIFIGLFASNVLFGCGRIKEGMTEGSADHLTKIANDKHKKLAAEGGCPDGQKMCSDGKCKAQCAAIAADALGVAATEQKKAETAQ